MTDDEDNETVKQGLRDIISAPGVSGKALEAKASAARTLARPNGTDLPAEARERVEEKTNMAADPMADITPSPAEKRLLWRAQNVLTGDAYEDWMRRYDRGVSVAVLKRTLDRYGPPDDADEFTARRRRQAS